MDFSKADPPGPPPGEPTSDAWGAAPPAEIALRDSWLRSGLSVVLGRGVDSVLRFVLFLATARILAPADFNLYALLTAALATAQSLVSFASPRVSLYFHSRGRRGSLFAWLMLSACAGSALVFAAFTLVGALRRTFFPGVSPAMLLLGLSPLPFLLLSDSLSAALLSSGREKMYAATLWMRTIGIAAILLTSLTAVATDRLAWLLWGRLAVNGVVAVFIAIAAHARPSADGLGSMARSAIRYGLPAAAGAAVVSLHRRADVFLLAAFGHSTEIGGYAICYAMAEAFWVLTDSVEASLFVRLSQSETVRAAALAREAFRRFWTIGLAAGIAGLIGGEGVLLIGFRSRFPGAPQIFPWVLVGVVAWGISRPFGSFLYSRARTGAMFGCHVTGLIANLLACMLLIPRFGALGAAVSSAASYTFEAAIIARLFHGHSVSTRAREAGSA